VNGLKDRYYKSSRSGQEFY